MNNRLSLLVVDDEDQILEFLVEEFSREYEVKSALSAAAAWSAIDSWLPDLVLLDVSMPGMTGLELCKKMRSTLRIRDIPILFLSARNELETVVSAFDLGADDFIEKPFRIEELKARVASKLRKKRENSTKGVRCGNMMLDLRGKSVEVAGKPVKFSSLEFNLLRFFAENPNRIINRQEVIDAVWEGEKISARTVDAHLVSVRKRISSCDYEIHSLYGEGYKLSPKKKKLSFLK